MESEASSTASEPLKSGMSLSVETPAPVNTTVYLDCLRCVPDPLAEVTAISTSLYLGLAF